MVMIFPVVTSEYCQLHMQDMFLAYAHTISGMDLRINLHPAVFRYHLLGYRHSFVNRNSLVDYCIVLHAVFWSVFIQLKDTV